jgi:UDPglucose--hexose-1-phosphate uridylyltransferase
MHSEFRQDLVTGDWILIAPGRARRPLEFIKKQAVTRQVTPIATCPFEDPEASNQEKAMLRYGTPKKWEVQVLQNKFPAVALSPKDVTSGAHRVFHTLEGVGVHDLVISREHMKNYGDVPLSTLLLVFRALRERYRLIEKSAHAVAYVSMFHNWGPTAGASIYHPHLQMIGLPIIPPDITHSLTGSRTYHEAHDACVHCTIIAQEKKDGRRVIFENRGAIAFAPFTSRVPFELRIFPKQHSSYFESAGEAEIKSVAEVLKATLQMIKKRLHDPDYNFFIHTAPILEKQRYGHYHWHIEVEPKISTPAGFELSTGIEINVIDPDTAAAILLGKKIVEKISDHDA